MPAVAAALCIAMLRRNNGECNMKIVVYPQQLGNAGLQSNPYICDFVAAMTAAGAQVANGPARNPLIGMLPRCLAGDALVLHWLENVPDYKHGAVQTVCALAMLAAARLTGHKVVWFLHNNRSHAASHQWQKRLITRALMRHSSLVVTHASQGLDALRSQCPERKGRAVWLHHPTKNRIALARECRNAAAGGGPEADVLIWGTISPYKGVDQWLQYVVDHQLPLRVRIVGHCGDAGLAGRIAELARRAPAATFINRSITFDQLAAEVARARFVLVPYAAESVLSSGILMDSLSVGAKVIGPDVGSFRDYAAEPLLSVSTFRSLADVARIVAEDGGQPADLDGYERFLDAHSWAHFAGQLTKLIEEL